MTRALILELVIFAALLLLAINALLIFDRDPAAIPEAVEPGPAPWPLRPAWDLPTPAPPVTALSAPARPVLMGQPA